MNNYLVISQNMFLKKETYDFIKKLKINKINYLFFEALIEFDELEFIHIIETVSIPPSLLTYALELLGLWSTKSDDAVIKQIILPFLYNQNDIIVEGALIGLSRFIDDYRIKNRFVELSIKHKNSIIRNIAKEFINNL